MGGIICEVDQKYLEGPVTTLVSDNRHDVLSEARHV